MFMADHKEDIVRAVRKLGANDRHFTASEIRRECEIDATDPSARASVYNMLRSLSKTEVIESVPGNRKRNRYYRVADPDRLRNTNPISSRLSVGSSDGEKRTGAPDRLARMEQEIRSVNLRLEELGQKLDGLLSLWQ
jgi:sugar-specific transcriptional regulator TrmB